MSSLALLVVLLLVLVGLLLIGGLAYVAYRHPKAVVPLTLALCGAAVLASVVMPVAVR
ncbi:hypothetical protein OG291_03170 [Streptomyces halstedii]|uniref:hypothetical protein n=1 Tax=Streptomyces halstedii TaxID=1944 RepID=UPI00386E85A9|nr:hypothetical protein OG291_03170 [Streptomyces halstedii]